MKPIMYQQIWIERYIVMPIVHPMIPCSLTLYIQLKSQIPYQYFERMSDFRYRNGSRLVSNLEECINCNHEIW